MVAERLQIVEVLVEDRHPHGVLLDRAHGEDAEVAAGQREDRVAGGRHVRAIGRERPHVLDGELVRQVVAAPADHVEGVRGMHAARVEAIDLGDDLEAAALVARVERAREAIVGAAVRDEVAGGRRLRLLRIARE